ncbi:unnamed protein product [Acanthosepion pharaonis]|uniref:Apextrin C-terminal domain-containing protein n=1 Tax=Acanthosepion pharaonis TaxID=158019 RepID=A0A812E9L5_ACAPH|nr:unnamed protein product [Sepia pharaonis]
MAGKRCPGTDWLPVNRYHCIFGFVDSSKGPHLGSKPQVSSLRETICTKGKKRGRKWRRRRRRRRNWESGSYCILKNGNCPPGFESGFIQIKEYNSSIMTSTIRKTMAKHCADFSIRNDYCCRQDDSALKPITLPTASPFILLMSNLYESCQQTLFIIFLLEGMIYKPLSINLSL